MARLPEFLDESFDEIEFQLGTDKEQPQVKAVAHCSCREAIKAHNEKHPNFKLHHDKDNRTLAPLTMPTAADDTCPHCGYFVVYQRPNGELRVPNAARFRSQALIHSSTSHGAVVGTSAITGETVEFPSANAAYSAGYGEVRRFLGTGRTLHGFTWERKQA